MNIIKEIFDDFGDGNIINIQLVSFYEKKQEVERAFERIDFNLIIGCVHAANSLTANKLN